MATTPDYLDELKARLDITYLDESGENKLLSICKNAEGFLNRKAGETLTFSTDGDRWMLELLFNCVLYMRSNALNEFEVNYGDDLMILRAYSHYEEVKEEESESDDESEEGGE